MHSLMMYTLIAMMMTTLLFMAPILLSMSMKKWSNKMLSFECGMSLNFMSRNPFSIRFFLLMVLFIIFDLEITLILAAPMLTPWSKHMALFFFLFIIVLTSGVIYEWLEGSLTWKS